MATTGEKYPTAAVTAAESPWLDNDWNTPGNVYADDGATANVIAASYDSPDQTYVLKASGFDFSSIPMRPNKQTRSHRSIFPDGMSSKVCTLNISAFRTDPSLGWRSCKTERSKVHLGTER